MTDTDRARTLRGLASTLSLSVLTALRDRPRTPTELVEQTGMNRGLTSEVVGNLILAGLVDRTMVGVIATYSLRRETIVELGEWLLELARTDKTNLTAHPVDHLVAPLEADA